jgi:hypothetical protein
MRKIEQQMLNAIHTKTDKWVKDNTGVFYLSANETGNPFGARSEIYLHGNLIAEYWHDRAHLNSAIEVDTSTLKRYPTNTTKSRLRALGANVTTKKGITYLDGVAV